MSETDKSHDYAQTLTMPKNVMPMKVTQQDLEKEILERWRRNDLYGLLRKQSKGRKPFILHDGPPYANGHTHVGHALNKILKDAVVRSRQMQGFDSPYVPGWDCHGLPIEWKVEEQFRAAGLNKDDVPTEEFRAHCRKFADTWVDTQAAEFQRLGVLGDFENRYTTMAFGAEASIARALMQMAKNGLVYRGSKPVMWSVVERTSLAEAEIEHQEYESDAVWVKFPVKHGSSDLVDAFVVVWTTTPWTLPANRAVSYTLKAAYSLYEVVSVERDFGPEVGELYLLSEALSDAVAKKAKLELRRVRSVSVEELSSLVCAHPLKMMGYYFGVPLLLGDHVTDDTGTGFVHTAPSHGREDHEVWAANAFVLEQRGFDTAVPFTVDDAGFLTDAAPGFGPSALEGAARVYDDDGKKGDANERVIKSLIEQSALVARSRHKHLYPHSWRSKKPVLFRNTPQWFVTMSEGRQDRCLREVASKALDNVSFVPKAGKALLTSMVETRPDWVLSRQRKWGVPVTVFYDENGNILSDDVANEKVVEAFTHEGADAWFAEGAKDRFLGHRDDVHRWRLAQDIVDVWFDSGCTQFFVMEDQLGHSGPADVYLEGSDQHRGWFQSSLLVGCAVRERAPYKAVVTHGFVLAENGKKMAKSADNGLSPQKVVDRYGADVLRLWALTCDYREDVRFGDSFLKTSQDMLRKLRNTFRWMVGMLPYFNGMELQVNELPELERYMLHRLCMLEKEVQEGYEEYDFKRVVRAVSQFMANELSAFYFDVRKDSLYCDPRSSSKRQASLYVLFVLFRHLTVWLAPALPFLAEEAWLAVYPGSVSVHLEQFPAMPAEWVDMALADKWEVVMAVRSVVNGCLEIERKAKNIGKPSEARPVVFLTEPLASLMTGVPLAEICLTSGLDVETGLVQDAAFEDEAVPGVGVVFRPALGRRCARSWIVSDDVGADPEYPDVSLRDAAALRELEGV